MAQLDLLKATVSALERAGATYMLTGSWASSIQGEPRSTHDVDLVVSLGPEALEALIKSFPSPRYYLDREVALVAIRTQKMFQLLDSEEGDKIDFWMLTGEPFDQSRFARRRTIEIGGLKVAVSSPEDTMLMKLLWSRKSGGSEKQLRDVRRIREIQAAQLDKAYLEEWLRKLDLTDEWASL